MFTESETDDCDFGTVRPREDKFYRIKILMEKIKHFRELRVYQTAIKAAMEIFELTRSFPAEEKCSMVDQIRRSLRSVCANLAEA